MRTLREIAVDIRRNWDEPNYAARPYIDAMYQLETIEDMYVYEDGRSIVLYFLSNASTWRGPEARRIKMELKAMVK